MQSPRSHYSKIDKSSTTTRRLRCNSRNRDLTTAEIAPRCTCPRHVTLSTGCQRFETQVRQNIKENLTNTRHSKHCVNCRGFDREENKSDFFQDSASERSRVKSRASRSSTSLRRRYLRNAADLQPPARRICDMVDPDNKRSVAIPRRKECHPGLSIERTEHQD